MRMRSLQSPALAAVAVCVLSGCASAPQGSVETSASEVKVYNSGQLPNSRYEVVSRMWVASWQPGYSLPQTYATQDDAIAALQNDAARAGADGLINVICLDEGRARWFTRAEPAILCYGNAIRVKPSEG